MTAVVGFIVFANKKNLIHFEKPVLRPDVLKKAVTNGCSEMAHSACHRNYNIDF